MNTLTLISGLGVVAGVIALMTYASIKGFDLSKQSFSGAVSKSPNTTRIICYLAAISGIVFGYGIWQVTGSVAGGLLAIVACVSLIFTAITINKPSTILHQTFGGVFIAGFILMPPTLTITAIKYFSEPVLIAINITSIISIVILSWKLLRRSKLDGMTEFMLFGINCMWVVLVAGSLG